MGFLTVRYLGKSRLIAGTNGVLESCESQTRLVLPVGPVACLQQQHQDVCENKKCISGTVDVAYRCKK
jgi:hypothetical protein